MLRSIHKVLHKSHSWCLVGAYSRFCMPSSWRTLTSSVLVYWSSSLFFRLSINPNVLGHLARVRCSIHIGILASLVWIWSLWCWFRLGFGIWYPIPWFDLFRTSGWSLSFRNFEMYDGSNLALFHHWVMISASLVLFRLGPNSDGTARQGAPPFLCRRLRFRKEADRASKTIQKMSASGKISDFPEKFFHDFSTHVP